MTPPPARSPGSPAESAVAERLLATASDLFYREGINAVGIQRVIDEAGVAKASLYAHFASKDDLVAACLARRSEAYQARVAAELAPLGDPVARVLRLFDVASEWMVSGDFRGCPFANADGELASPSHPARAIVSSHFAWVLALLTRLVGEAGLPEPDRLAGALMNLLQGATTRALAEGTADAARDARWAAERLLAGAIDARPAARAVTRAPRRRRRTPRR